MNKLISSAMLAVALSLGACATGPVSPMEAASALVCKDGTSVKEVFASQQVAHDDINLSISRVAKADSKINHRLMAGGVAEADTVVVISAVDKVTTKRTPGSLVLYVKDGCVVGQEFMKSEEADQVGVL